VYPQRPWTKVLVEVFGAVPIAVIVNPTAGSGRARGVGKRLEELVPGAKLYWTQGAGDGKRLAGQAARDGARIIVAVGGDGTISECCSGIASSCPPGERPALALVPAGTGSDYCRTFGLDGQVDLAVERILRGRRTPVDLGRYQLGPPEAAEVGYFNNVLSFGIGGLTDRIVSQGPKWLGGRLAFFLGGVKATIAYSPTPMRLTFDDGQVEFGALQNVAVCIGKYFGGGMKVAPGAAPSDGYFDVVMMGGSKLQTLALAKDIYLGSHLTRPHVRLRRAISLSVETTRPGEVLVDADGEQVGQLPLSITIEANAIELLLA
jgi:diacylglycerol kinase (ATP)